MLNGLPPVGPDGSLPDTAGALARISQTAGGGAWAVNGATVIDLAARQREPVSRMTSAAFAALDIAGSAVMKERKSPQIIDRVFLRFHEVVEEALCRQRRCRLAWCGDGVLARFPSPVAAAEGVIAALDALEALNRETAPLIGAPFHVRSGISWGLVLAEWWRPVEKVFSQVADLAGHLQKRASAENGLLISAAVRHQLPPRMRAYFVRFPEAVDGWDVFEYSPTSATTRSTDALTRGERAWRFVQRVADLLGAMGYEIAFFSGRSVPFDFVAFSPQGNLGRVLVSVILTTRKMTPEHLQQLATAVQEQNAGGAVLISRGALSASLRRLAEQYGIQSLDGEPLARLMEEYGLRDDSGA